MAAGDPTGEDLCSVTVDVSTLPNYLNSDYTTFTFSSTAPIITGKKYAIVVGTSSVDEIEKLEWAQDTNAGYANGLKCISSDSGSTWTQVSSRDCFFKTRAVSGIKEQFISGSVSQQAIYESYYIAQIFTAASTYTIIAVDLRLHQGVAGGSTGTATISLREVEDEDYGATKAENPTPANSATEVDFTGFQLSWDDGGGADTFDVYMGKSGSLTLVSSAQVGTTYTTTLEELETIFDASPIDQKIYWRIDSSNVNETTTGDEWNFDARPGVASGPSPEDIATDESLNSLFEWTGSDIATSFDAYFDTGEGLEKLGDALEDSEWTPIGGLLNYSTEYTWRIDSTNSFGTTQGDEWSFTTLAFDQLRVSYRLITGGGGSGPYDDPPGEEGVDWVYTGGNCMMTVKKMVAAASNKIWIGDV